MWFVVGLRWSQRPKVEGRQILNAALEANEAIDLIVRSNSGDKLFGKTYNHVR